MKDEPTNIVDWYVNRSYWKLGPAATLTRLRAEWSGIVNALAPICEPADLSDDGETLCLRLNYSYIQSIADPNISKLKAQLGKSVLFHVRTVTRITSIRWEDGEPSQVDVEEAARSFARGSGPDGMDLG